MSSRTSLSATGLSKSYEIRGARSGVNTFREALGHRLSRPLQRPARRTVWALEDLTFEIDQGEAVGVIGANGAGKSTLLKVLSRITKPTRGRADTYGRVGSLLEVGTGFHPELTGRENVYLNGAILGMSRREINTQFEGIVDFAGIAEYLDTPVKRFSTGMSVRLAFAVAAHLRADLLMVDEVLAVGDAAFQKRSLAKMHEVAAGGRTVLFVSHSLQSVASLCQSALVLDSGRLIYQGPTRQAIATYLARLSVADVEDADPAAREGSGEMRIRRVVAAKPLFDPADHKAFDVSIHDGVDLRGQFFVSAHLHEEAGEMVAHMDSRVTGDWFESGTRQVQLEMASPWLKPGKYFLDVFLCHPSGIYDAYRAACRFEVSPVLPYAGVGTGENQGIVLADYAYSTKSSDT